MFDRIFRNVKDFLNLDEKLSELGVDLIVTTHLREVAQVGFVVL
jgi:hypothetical protein